MSSGNTTINTERRRASGARSSTPVLTLTVVWSSTEPGRVGELLVPPEGEPVVFGRSSEPGAVVLVRQRPGTSAETGPLESRAISREQWRILAGREALTIENIGRRELLHNGVMTTKATARAGDLVEIRGQLLMLVVARPAQLPPQTLPPGLLPRFGEADEFGVVGESAVAWELRRQLAFAAGRDDHVLLTGGSGSGKELAARAIHGLSRRKTKALVSRNAATFPDALIDAELFGNPRDFPNPGMAERPGMIGAADGSTLFLDEIGELSHPLQAHLLRVVDTGEFHRIGEARPRHADIRLVAATNRDPTSLKHDLLARLLLRVRLPGLDKRREDVPLIARHLLRDLARRDALVAERAFPGGDPAAEPSWSAGLVTTLVTAPYPTNVRELKRRLWEVIADGTASGLGVPADAATADATPANVDPQSITASDVLAALAAAGGSRDQAWRALGLRSRHQLLRLMRRLGIKDDHARRSGKPPVPSPV